MGQKKGTFAPNPAYSVLTGMYFIVCVTSITILKQSQDVRDMRFDWIRSD